MAAPVVAQAYPVANCMQARLCTSHSHVVVAARRGPRRHHPYTLSRSQKLGSESIAKSEVASLIAFSKGTHERVAQLAEFS